MNTGIDEKTEGSGSKVVTPVAEQANTNTKMSLVDRMLAKSKEYVAPEEEVLSVNIRDIKPTKDPKRVMMVTDKGNLFAFTNTFDGGVPVGSKEFKAEITMRENKNDSSYVNIVRVKYDLESIGKYSFVATHKLAVTL